MGLREVTLDDKYTLLNGRIFVTGIQALVRLPMLQKLRDERAGLNTAGYISGYRGSPLGALDQQLVRATGFLQQHNIVFQPGLNEELAATACSGTQQINLQGEGAYDGVFSMWYGKGPGVDRSGDAFRHANNFGTAEHGGMIALLGDDHACESSTTAHQSEYAMVDAMIPVLNPAGVQDILDYGLYGFAMSRFTGAVIGFKCVHDTVEATASIEVSEERTRIVLPEDFDMPQGGLNIRRPDTFLEQEMRVHTHKLNAARAFVYSNKLDQCVIDPPDAWLGIATTGKSYLDVRQALNELGIDDQLAASLGIRVYKIAMPWPLEPQGLKHFARGLQSIVVVEEKRGLIEEQIKSQLYGQANAPQVEGKTNLQGKLLFPSTGRLNAAEIAIRLGQRIAAKTAHNGIAGQLDRLTGTMQRNAERTPPSMTRLPYFCAGCPHNTGTKIPEGSKALSGIGCHFMVQWMDRNTAGYTQMGGEGASWIGEAPFSKRGHMFQNIGDGTYYHSGILALRASVASGVNVTFKILFNDAVAMTGGQPMDGPLSPAAISQQVYGEGAKRIAVVTDEPDKYPSNTAWAPDVSIHHRDTYDQLQREFREIEGTTVIIYDQTCAAEKRRRRKRGEFPDPPKRLFINTEVCEGCGDCGLASNCVAILPENTSLGRKRRIDQSACNKDYSCVKGFCPSFVSVHGGALRSGKSNNKKDNRIPAADSTGITLTEPVLPALDQQYNIVLTGVGGTGVVTIGAIIGMAAHIAGLGCSILDMLGLAQKGGSVTSHIIIAGQPEDISTTHIAAGGAQLLLGCDIVTAASGASLDRLTKSSTQAVINTHAMMSGDFTRNRNTQFPLQSLQESITSEANESHFINATQLAEQLLGNTIGANMFMLGYAWQLGLVPLPQQAILKAIELNGQSVAMNTSAFEWGRRAAIDQNAVETLATPTVIINLPEKLQSNQQSPEENIEHLVDDRAARLTDYQSRRYAARYRSVIEKLHRAEQALGTNARLPLTRSAAKHLYKLMAYKDEYEVARLYSNGAFKQSLNRQFEGDFTLKYHLAPPMLTKKDPVTGVPQKREFGAWVGGLFRWIAPMKVLRGTPLDLFGYTAERQQERRLRDDYEALLLQLASTLNESGYQVACELAELPDGIRGFGHVKAQSIKQYQSSKDALLSSSGNQQAA
jgi:indolepyruvate ferredoxin oxidoreductase